MNSRLRVIIGTCALLAGCGTTRKAELVHVALEEQVSRDETFEAMLAAMDANPTYADELFQKARKHPKALDRLLANTAAGVDDDALARLLAWHLIQNPRNLQKILTVMLDAAEYDRPARIGLARAIEERGRLVADITTDRPAAVEATVRATIDYTVEKPEAREAFMSALRGRAGSLAGLLNRHPQTLRRLTEAVLENGQGEARKLLGEVLGVTQAPSAKVQTTETRRRHDPDR